ncbi:MAG: zf-HC2 domain-containing protein [Spirochaetaceae bacterium]|nr:zf-HC2 domain-containing protein [Myxococcales bacterium]MCB9723365.1 zf-HC2 domain-containing protein [Spirochaetaceae bacterium]HPG28019.1 zf-HC2 domain-containing protein [Myxococcota bacterium]
MNHREVQKGLADYLEGDLPLSTRARFDAHLEECGECAREVGEMQQTIRLLRAMPDPEPPPMIAADVMRRIRAGETRLGPFQRVMRVLTGVLEPAFVLPASAVAVAALVVMVMQGPSGGARFGLDGFSVGEESAAVVVTPSLATAAASSPASVHPGVAGAARATAAPVAVTRPVPAVPVPDTERAVPSRSPRVRHSESGLAESWMALQAEASAGAARSVAVEGPVPAFRGGPSRPLLVADRIGAQGLAHSLAQPQRHDGGVPFSLRVPQLLAPVAPTAATGEDARDLWLARAFEDPVGFTRYIASQSLAEQELWVTRLSERAAARGLLDELVDALRVTGDERARHLADDFSASVTRRAGDVRGD